MSWLSKSIKKVTHHAGGLIGGGAGSAFGPVGAILGYQAGSKLDSGGGGGGGGGVKYDDTDIGKMAARGELLGAFPELTKAFDAQGIPHANPIPLTFNKRFGTALLGQSAQQQTRAADDARTQAMDQLSQSGLLGSGQRAGFERDFAAQQSNQRYETIQNLMIEARQSRRAEKLEALSGFLAAIGQANQAQVLAQQAASIRQEIQANRKASQLLPISLGIQGLGAVGNAVGAVASIPGI